VVVALAVQQMVRRAEKAEVPRLTVQQIPVVVAALVAILPLRMTWAVMVLVVLVVAVEQILVSQLALVLE
jgi:hypothetical protein